MWGQLMGVGAFCLGLAQNRGNDALIKNHCHLLSMSKIVDHCGLNPSSASHYLGDYVLTFSQFCKMWIAALPLASLRVKRVTYMKRPE